jgi:hypothetical protein
MARGWIGFEKATVMIRESLSGREMGPRDARDVWTDLK